MLDRSLPRNRVTSLAVVFALALPAAADAGGGHGHRGQAAPFVATPSAARGPDSDAVIQIEGELADARNRMIELTAWIVGLGALQTLIFAAAMIAAARAVRGARHAGQLLPLLERAYLFVDPDIALTVPDHRGPHGGLKVGVDFALKNHGKTPAVIDWLTVRLQYLAEPPADPYEESGSGGGLVIGAGQSLRFDRHEAIVPGADWDKAEAGQGAIWLHGRVVYHDVLKSQHESYFAWRHDPARNTFSIAEQSALNRYD